MLRKDFIMRQFEEFGKVMAVLLGLKKQNDWEKFKEEIANAGKKFTPFEMDIVESLSLPDFEAQVLHNPVLLHDQQKMLADLLYEKMEFYANAGEAEKYTLLGKKCLLLYTQFTSNLTQNEFNLDVYYKLQLLSKL